MKAVCLLLCLALARLGAGSIFHRRHYPSMDSLVAESADYIDPYLQAELYQQRQYQQEAQRPQFQEEYRNNRFVPQRRQEPLKKNLLYVKEDYAQQNQEYRPEQPTYSRDLFQNQDEVFSNKKLVAEKQTIRRNADSSSIESGSHETMKARQVPVQQYDQKFADLDTPRVYSSAVNEMPNLYGDEVAWRGLEVASGPNFPIKKEDIEKIFKSAQFATKHIKPETKSKLHESVEAAQTATTEAKLNATELLQKNQYPVEEHIIKTEDGYYLTLFRIPPKQQTPEEKATKVVFLMHGLLGSADDWLLMGPGKSLAYLLADAGYDVYLGNARGNRYTRHASKHRAQPDFWQYSNDEVALFDLPAMIDYVLKLSKEQKMYYIGHSQGNTAFFALAAARPEYNDKIEAMYALSPMVYMSQVRSPLVRMIAPSSPFYERLSSLLGKGEFMPSKEVVHTIGGAMCENEIGCKNMCSNVYFVMAGVNVQNMEPREIPTIMSHLPAGGSTKQMYHFGQGVDSHEFRMFDYGSELNVKVYGQNQPPKYNMEKVTVPVVLYYSEHDWLAHPKNVEKLRNELPNATSYKIPQDYFSHIDFQYSKQAPEMVNKNLIESIQNKQYNKQSNKQQQRELQ